MLLVCCGCNEARYCSEARQKEDWLDGGHKVLCQGPPSAIKIHMILGELFVAEFQGLKSLDDDDISTLFKDDFQDNPFNHLVLSGEVALVLARANPSVRRLFSAISATSTRTRLAASFFEQVLSPW